MNFIGLTLDSGGKCSVRVDRIILIEEADHGAFVVVEIGATGQRQRVRETHDEIVQLMTRVLGDAE